MVKSSVQETPPPDGLTDAERQADADHYRATVGADVSLEHAAELRRAAAAGTLPLRRLHPMNDASLPDSGQEAAAYAAYAADPSYPAESAMQRAIRNRKSSYSIMDAEQFDELLVSLDTPGVDDE